MWQTWKPKLICLFILWSDEADKEWKKNALKLKCDRTSDSCFWYIGCLSKKIDLIAVSFFVNISISSASNFNYFVDHKAQITIADLETFHPEFYASQFQRHHFLFKQKRHQLFSIEVVSEVCCSCFCKTFINLKIIILRCKGDLDLHLDNVLPWYYQAASKKISWLNLPRSWWNMAIKSSVKWRGVISIHSIVIALFLDIIFLSSFLQDFLHFKQTFFYSDSCIRFCY